MPRVKTTISVDRDTLAAACELLGTTSVSEAVDVTLARFVSGERLSHDLRAYMAGPPTPEEVLLGEIDMAFDLGDEEIDYDEFYGDCGPAADDQ